MAVIIANAAELVTFSASPVKNIFTPFDTVIIILDATIVPGYLLYGNPLGPGDGRPLTIQVISDDPGIQWLTVRKAKAKKYGPPFGEWVWAWEKETHFYCVGVVTTGRLGGRKIIRGAFRVEGLLCEKTCRLFREDVPFIVRIDPHSPASGCLINDKHLLKKYRNSPQMMELRQSAADTAGP